MPKRLWMRISLLFEKIQAFNHFLWKLQNHQLKHQNLLPWNLQSQNATCWPNLELALKNKVFYKLSLRSCVSLSSLRRTVKIQLQLRTSRWLTVFSPWNLCAYILRGNKNFRKRKVIKKLRLLYNEAIKSGNLLQSFY